MTVLLLARGFGLSWNASMLGALGLFRLACLKINKKLWWLLPRRHEEPLFGNIGRTTLPLILNCLVLCSMVACRGLMPKELERVNACKRVLTLLACIGMPFETLHACLSELCCL